MTIRMYGEPSRERNLNLIHNSFREQSSSPKIDNYQFTKESAVGLFSGYSSVQGIKKQLVSSLLMPELPHSMFFSIQLCYGYQCGQSDMILTLGKPAKSIPNGYLVWKLFGRVSYNQTQGIRKIQSEKREVSQGTSQKSVWKDANCPKRGKTRVAQSPLVLNLHLIG